MIPMGTIVTACMFAGFLVAVPFRLVRIPAIVRKIVAVVVLAAGLWNLLWYSSQHITEFWGIAALVSGVLMIITALTILAPAKLPQLLNRAKPVILVLLLGCAFLYAITIARL